ncbi:MAG: aminotransferase class V-fold PLP-dependent enzyme [Planctomycetes bacterium]|nr:aminotransferase class V-fold PLP-dependent enzyme [Planctomycetota bacterium]
MDGIYLDNAATSWPKPEEVYRAVERYMRECGGTPARGRHPRATEAGRILSECRTRLQALLGAGAGYRLVFTSGATESLNLALKGFLPAGAHVVVTELEHNSVMRPLSALRRQRGMDWSVVPADGDGAVDPARVREALRPGTRLVVVSHASNVVGTVVDLAGILEVAHASGVPVLVDAAQTVGVVPIDLAGLGVDLFAFTGHKSLLGPPGTGALIFREDLSLEPLKQGGTGTLGDQIEQPDGFPDRYETGSPNMYGIAGLEAGVRVLEREGVEAIRKKKVELVGRLREGLARVPSVRVYGAEDPRRSVGIVSFNVGAHSAERVADMLWEHGAIMVRAGLHCAPYIHGRLGTASQGTVRVGIGFASTAAHVDACVAAAGAAG